MVAPYMLLLFGSTGEMQMKSLTELFYKVNRNVPYITVGDGVDYCFIQEDKTLYIYFEPSDGKIDWKHNFMFRKKPYKDMKTPYYVHRGFLKCWKTVEDIVIDRIQDPTINEIIVIFIFIFLFIFSNVYIWR